MCTCIFGREEFEIRHQEESSYVKFCGTDPLRESVLCREICISECINALQRDVLTPQIYCQTVD